MSSVSSRKTVSFISFLSGTGEIVKRGAWVSRLKEMYYNGRMAPIPIKRLELAGLYQFRLWDRAGNERYYQIRIAERLRPPSPKTIIITILGVGAAAGWFFYQRRHPRFL